jgi:hypothetical protein
MRQVALKLTESDRKLLDEYRKKGSHPIKVIN